MSCVKKGSFIYSFSILSILFPLTRDQFSSVAQLCPTLCDPMDCSMPDFPVLHYLPELAHTHVHWVSDAIQPSHPLLSPSPPALNLSQHQGLFKWVSSLYQVAKLLEFQLQHQSIQWTPRSNLQGLVIDWEAWRASVHGIAKTRTRLSDWTEQQQQKNLSALSNCSASIYEVVG